MTHSFPTRRSSDLQTHRWKCITRLTRPGELHSDDGKQGVYTNDSGIHRRGCSDSKNDCDCHTRPRPDIHVPFPAVEWASILSRSEEHTSELQSLMRISYAVFCLKKKKKKYK